MTTPLSMSAVETLVKERAAQLDHSVTSDFVHVYEDPHATNGGALIVQIALKRPSNQRSWTEQRVQLSQAIRDALVRSGDERYPLLEIFEPGEWVGRND